ncbi:SDR family NAD(P)-dependent oxidoreductase [Nonomuraea sp. NPDC049784]|uniref:SDR family NAD(P)-dependent oxidoreductase n=1 Tax=Nonomuraea sp. NPDC049784 TaxID=3154361 RepID=UPI0033DF4460
MSSSRVSFITGGSSGLGYAIADAALAGGGTALLGAQRTRLLDPLIKRYPGRVIAYPLEVTKLEQIEAAATAAVGRFGVPANNAGQGQLGALEETSDAELHQLFDVHVFGPVALIRAVLPVIRRQRSGAIVQMSSGFGRYSALGLSAYSATKFALEGLSQALAAEAEPFGIRVPVDELGALRTSILGQAFHHSRNMPEYEEITSSVRGMLAGLNGGQPGDPAKAAVAILTVLNSDHPPLRPPLGIDALDGIRDEIAVTSKELDTCGALSRATTFDNVSDPIEGSS